MIKPKALKFGDTLGLIAPASNTTEENVQRSIKKLQDLGFKVKDGKSIFSVYGMDGVLRHQRNDRPLRTHRGCPRSGCFRRGEYDLAERHLAYAV